jgi:hypothetical protein
VALGAVDLAAIAAQREQPGQALSAIVELRERLDELEEYQVEKAREQGWSWSEIAQPLRVTRQAAHHKWAKRLEEGRREGGRGRVVVRADARRCVARARREATTLGHDSVDTDHLLLGLAVEQATARVLVPLGLSPPRVRGAVLELRRDLGRRPRAETEKRESIPISDAARRVLEQSLSEALRLDDEEIAAEHLLLASLRDEESAVRSVLDRLGVAAATIEERLGRVDAAGAP